MTEEKKQEVIINLEGTSPAAVPKTLVKEGEYKGEIVSIDLIDAKKFKSEELEKRLVFNIKLDGVKETIPLFCNPKIMKGNVSVDGTKYSNSKLFDVLESAGLLGKVAEKQGEVSSLDGLRLFLSSELVGVAGRFGVETARKGQEGEYSVVKKVYEFVFDSKPVVVGGK